jgi:GT2 family glycosyltransferase
VTGAEYRAQIAPVPDGVARPRWSVMIPVFHSAGFLRHTLRSVLQQDPGPAEMQIEVVDDHSVRDDPEAVTREVGGGRVGFFRQPENVGHARNFESCLQRSRGHLVHLLHGDDAVRDGFYGRIQEAFESAPTIGAAFCRQIIIDDDGHWVHIGLLEQEERGVIDGWLDRIASGQRLQTPAMVVRRSVYERLGGFDRRLTWTEDWEMWVRIATECPVWYEPEPLALYRVHSTSSSSRKSDTGETIKDLRRAIEIMRTYLPRDRADVLARAATRACAHAAIRRGHRFVAAGMTTAARAHAREAVRTEPSPTVIAGAAIVTLKSLLAARAPRPRTPTVGPT